MVAPTPGTYDITPVDEAVISHQCVSFLPSGSILRSRRYRLTLRYQRTPLVNTTGAVPLSRHINAHHLLLKARVLWVFCVMSTTRPVCRPRIRPPARDPARRVPIKEPVRIATPVTNDTPLGCKGPCGIVFTGQLGDRVGPSDRLASRSMWEGERPSQGLVLRKWGRGRHCPHA